MSICLLEDYCHEYRRICCLHCGKTFDVPVYCGNRFCEICSKPRLNRIRQRLSWLCSKVRLQPAYSLKHLTLTIKNQPDLDDMLKDLVKSFRKLRNRQFWKQHVLGGAFVLEVTGEPDNWHAHIHAIIESKFIDFYKLLDLWKICSPGKGVYLQRIPAGHVIGYLTKYLSKPSVPAEHLDEVSACIQGFRLFQPFGTWYAINNTFEMKRAGCPECGFQLFFPIDILFRMSDGDTIPCRSP